MKTQLFSVLCLALLFTACEKEADFASTTVTSPSPNDADPSTLSYDYCINLSSSSALVGFGKFEPMRVTGVQDNSARVRKPFVGMYTIEANGEGTSAELARSSTSAKLTFNSRTNRLSGVISTKFFNGEELEQHIDSDALVVFDRKSMIIKANVRTAKLNTDSEKLDLVRGELVLALPLHPQGWFEANLYTTGMFCTPVVN